jgi:hypothetical protein
VILLGLSAKQTRQQPYVVSNLIVDAKRNQREERERERERERNEIKRMKRKLSSSKGQVIRSIVFCSKYGNAV